MTNLWANREFLRESQYRTDANLAARQSIYAYQQPRIDLAARVLDLAAPRPGETIADIGCGNGRYLTELARRGFAARVLGADLSLGMLAAARSGLPTDHGGPALLAADASALPFRDGAVDLALAMHMLYHVPDPSSAVGELRRVTRPGGRVVIGLNGARHLRELRAAIAAARGDATGLRERTSLDDGAVLARASFSSVRRHDFHAELRIPGPEPIAEYIASMPATVASGTAGHHVGTVIGRLPRTSDGDFTITTHPGILVCQ